MDYNLSRQVILHAGFAHEPSAVPPATSSALFPQDEGNQFSLGATLHVSSSLSIVASYSHLHLLAAPIGQSDPNLGSISGTVERRFDSLGLQAVLRF
jgi:long-subunit fatty acid transport protein